MIHFDPSEIVNWADKADAYHQLPELVRRLILATVPQPAILDMPSGSSVRMPGWDGLLDVIGGNTWTPSGKSGWEFSCDKDSKEKADADYKKRTLDPGDIDPSESTFLFVTPRRWSGKSAWLTTRLQQPGWTDVRALDADDLVVWLDAAPSVAGWFARLIGKLPDTGVIPLDEWWESWSSATQPEIVPKLVLAGRGEQVEALREWAGSNPGSWYVQADTQGEAVAFLAAAAVDARSTWGSSVLGRALVVKTEDAWRSLEHHPYPLLLVRNFYGEVSPQIAVREGHHVLAPLDRSQDTMGSGQTLPRLGRAETIKSLISMGINEAEAASVIQKTARRLPTLRRFLIQEAGNPDPEWAATDSDLLVALVLLGQWEENKDGDKNIIEKLVGKPLEAIEQKLIALANAPDPPIVKIGQRWRFTSHEEAWHILAPRLGPSLISRYRDLATEVLEQVSPAFELPVGQRYLASIEEKVLPHSDTLRQGIVRGLALMGVHYDRVQLSDSAQYLPSKVVASSLAKGRGWQIWATLGNDLATLAEAAPDVSLDAVERDLAACPSIFEELFHQEDPSPLGRAPHTGLLWALERVAWSHKHFSRVAIILARLTELDPGGNVSNRPLESLRGLFLPWIRFSSLPDPQRLETLHSLLSKYPQVGWQVMINAYSSVQQTVSERRLPDWQPWGHGASNTPTNQEYQDFIAAMETLLVDFVQENAEKLAELAGIADKISPQLRQQTLALLQNESDSLRDLPASLALWDKLRRVLHHHRSYPDAVWAMGESELKAIHEVYEKLTPSDLVLANAWLFGRGLPPLPNPKPAYSISFEEIIDQGAEAQRLAVRKVYENGQEPAVTRLAEVAESPKGVGLAVSLGLESEVAVSLATANVGSPNPHLRELAQGILSALVFHVGWEPLEQVLESLRNQGWSPDQIAHIYLAANGDMNTWQRLESESDAVQVIYWRSVPAFQISFEDPENRTFAVRHLLASQRSHEVVGPLSLASAETELIIDVLTQAPRDLSRRRAAGEVVDIDGFAIASLLNRIDVTEDTPSHIIAGLELPFIPVLRHHRPHLALHREILNEPSLFADVVSWLFRPSDGRADEVVDEELRRVRAHIAFDILHELRGVPGQIGDGVVDPEALATWVTEARRLCRERGREAMGDRSIGWVLANAPPGSDGISPGEPIRDLLDAAESPRMAGGFVSGKLYSRGATTKGLLEGGERERSLSNEFGEWAQKLAARWPFTARILRDIARSYEGEARQFDQESNWLDSFES